MGPQRIWITIEENKLEIIDDRVIDIVKQRRPDEKFIEINKVTGDIAELVGLAMDTCAEMTAKWTEEHLKLREKLTQEVEIKLYKVTVKGGKHAYVVASNAEEAYQMFRSFLDTDNLMFERERALDRVELLAEEDKYAESLLLIKRV